MKKHLRLVFLFSCLSITNLLLAQGNSGNNGNGSQTPIPCVSLDFDGIDDYVTIPDSGDYQLNTGDFTFEAWIKASPTQVSVPQIISHRSQQANGYDGFLWCLSPNGQLCLQLNGQNYLNSGSIDLRNDAWHHVAATRSGAVIKYYVDGIETSTFTSSRNISTDVPTPVWIGHDQAHNTSNTPYHQNIDEVRIWNVARTEIEINNSMNTPLTGAENGLMGNWSMNEAADSTVTDKSPNGNDGTIVGPVWSFEGKVCDEPLVTEICGTMESDNLLRLNEPSYIAKRNNIEKYYQKYLANNTGSIKTSIDITIPVVVHIIHSGSAVGIMENISDAQIHSQIQVLNQDYSGSNSSLNNYDPAYTWHASDTQIKFELASTDPNGNTTCGITRHEITGDWNNDAYWADVVGPINRDVKPQTIWDRDSYLNIWVVDMPNAEIFGNSTFPGAPALEDGVIVSYKTFGNIGTAEIPYDLGGITTHEVGHWLNLYHTFHGNCLGSSNNDCANHGDLVCDTKQGVKTKGTNITGTGCPPQPSLYYSIPNFMSYLDDDSRILFTSGQKDRMQATISGSRSSLQNSLGLNVEYPTNLQALSPICVNGITSFSCDAYSLNCSNIEYEWQIMEGSNPLNYKTTTTPQATFVILSNADAVRVRINSGSSSSAWASIPVNITSIPDSPTFINVVSSNICNATNRYIEVETEGVFPAIAWEWFIDGVQQDLTYVPNVTLTNPLLGTSSSFNISVIAYTDCGASTPFTKTFTLNISPTLNKPVITPKTAYCGGTSNTFKIYNPQVGVEYVWNFEYTNAAGTFNLPPVSGLNLTEFSPDFGVKNENRRCKYNDTPIGTISSFTLDVSAKNCSVLEVADQLAVANVDYNNCCSNGGGGSGAAFKIAVSPNPGNGQVNINIPVGDGSMANIKITNAYGIEKKNITTSNLIETVNISDLSFGVYSVIVTKGNEIDTKHLQVTP